VVATSSKLRSLRSLKVDTGDPSLDEEFRARGVKVVADYKVEYRVRVE
jgi:predicted polyphosphate/ATP-dependent NAD kinase